LAEYPIEEDPEDIVNKAFFTTECKISPMDFHVEELLQLERASKK
jgi:hypothetical protein